MSEWVNKWSADNFINLTTNTPLNVWNNCLLVPHAHTAQEPVPLSKLNPSPFELWRNSRGFLSQGFLVPCGKRRDNIIRSPSSLVCNPGHCHVTSLQETGALNALCQVLVKGEALESCLTQTTAVLQGRALPLPQPQEAWAQAPECTAL